jgi:hypothetical protein
MTGRTMSARDYEAEYRRRLERGYFRGLSRAQARGHPEVGRPYASGRRLVPRYDAVLEEGVKELRNGATLSRAARLAGVPEERLRRYVNGIGVATRERGRWRIGVDRRPRVVVFYSRRRAIEIVVPGYEEAAQVGVYMNAVARVQVTNDPSVLAPFVGQDVRDVRGHFHFFETDPNELFRLMAAGPEPFELIYRIVA